MFLRNSDLIIVIVLITTIVDNTNSKMSYSDLIAKISSGDVKEIELSADELETAKRFIPEMEYSTLLDNATHGEESEFFKQKIKHVADMGRTIYENRNGASYNAWHLGVDEI